MKTNLILLFALLIPTMARGASRRYPIFKMDWPFQFWSGCGLPKALVGSFCSKKCAHAGLEKVLDTKKVS